MKSHKTIARTFGIFFLLAFVSYGLGSGIVASVTSETDSLRNLSSNQSLLVIGVILIALVHTIVNIGLPVLMVPILKPFNKVLSYGYLSAGISATVILIVGSIFLMLLIPLSTMYLNADPEELQHYETIGIILTKGNFYAYQIGMAIWGLGGLMFCYLLNISKIVPRGFAIWGFVGYLVFIAGTIFELFGQNIGVQLAIPGGLFEVSLSIWLILKGFKATALRGA
ncbi:MAG: DUF4386 domain-containing protein [Lewinellaceae bacterium]|nr:DUF4386 domain-containing protein [Lewinellaceae bacterium]